MRESSTAETSMRSPRRRLILSDRSFLSDLSEVPASQEAESSRDASLPNTHHQVESSMPQPAKTGVEELPDILLPTEEQPNPREENSPREDFATEESPEVDLESMQRITTGLFKFLSEPVSVEMRPADSESPKQMQPLAIDEPLTTEDEKALQVDEVVLEHDAASGEPCTSKSPKFGDCRALPELEETKDEDCPPLKPMVSPQVRAVSDYSKFTFGPRQVSDSSSDDESQPRPSDRVNLSPKHEIPHAEKKVERPLVPRLKLELVKPYESAKPLLTYAQCLELLLAHDYPAPPVEPKRRSCWRGLLKCCGQTQEHAAEVQRQCQQIFALDKRPLSDQDLDKDLLLSLWKRLSPSQSSIDWKSLGFRQDPRSESSTLGLLELLFLACEKPLFTVKLLETAKTRGTAFAFAEECLAAVSMALRVLRAGSLDFLIAETDNATQVFSFFFVGCLHAWFAEHTRSPGYVDRKQLEAKVLKNPRALILHVQRNVH